MAVPAIDTHDLTRRFKEVIAVDRLTLTVDQGTIFGFLGPNGAGKTTTVRLLLGLLKPTSGTASVLGYVLGKQNREIRIHTGVLLDTHGLYEKMNAVRNLQFYADVYRVPKETQDVRIRELLELADLWDRRTEPVEKWSRGMKQKLAIARAVLHNPELLIMDEPTAGLDPVSIKMVRDLIVSLAETKRHSIFLCTHNLDEAARVCDQIGVIKDGRLLLQDSPTALRQRMSTPQVRITGSHFSEELAAKLRQLPFVADARVENNTLLVEMKDTSQTEELVRQVVLAGAGVDEVVKPTKSLEDVYLQLVQEESK
jgi:ABC-2 type transport system ATP-binding protein